MRMIVRREKYNFVTIVFEPFLKMGIFLTYKIVSRRSQQNVFRLHSNFSFFPNFVPKLVSKEKG